MGLERLDEELWRCDRAIWIFVNNQSLIRLTDACATGGTSAGSQTMIGYAESVSHHYFELDSIHHTYRNDIVVSNMCGLKYCDV